MGGSLFLLRYSVVVQSFMIDLYVEQVLECCQRMSNTRRMRDFHISFHIAFTINTAKSLTLPQKLLNFIQYFSISCLSLCLDQLRYIAIDNRDALSSGIYAYIPTLISTLIANESHLALVWEVVAPCYLHRKKVAQLHITKV